MAATGTTTYTAAELLDLANAGTTSSPLTTRTLRYYTSLKLVDPPVTRPGQAARYTDRHLRQLEVVRQRRATGRGLAEIAAEFAADPEASTRVSPTRTAESSAMRGPATAADAVPAGLPLPDAATGVVGGAIPPIRPMPWPTATDAQVATIAPGVQVVLTGPALGDHALLRRLVDAANRHRFPHPLISNGEQRD